MIENKPNILDILSWVSIGLIVLISIGLMARHTPALLSLTTFWLGYWWRGILTKF
jgi:hypothetical protein